MRKKKIKLPIHHTDAADLFADVSFPDAHDIFIKDVLEDKDALSSENADCVSKAVSSAT